MRTGHPAGSRLSWVGLSATDDEMTLGTRYFADRPVGHATFENLDHLLTLEMRPYGLSQGIVPHLYRAARLPNSEPLTLQAAHQILGRAPTKVAIFTGMVVPGYMPAGETDGPLGAVVLARALAALGCHSSIVIEPEIAPTVRKIAEIVGCTSLTVLESDSLSCEHEAREFASGFGLGIAIEKLGVNDQGVRHTVGGNAVVTGDQWADTCIDEIRRSSGFTIGIGDNGNEIGFGRIASQIRHIVPYGEVSKSGHGGIIARQSCDLLIPCAVSNYGGYAISGALACLIKRPDLCVSADEIEKMLRRAIAMGCVNGGIEDDDNFIGDDGVPLEAARAYATLIGTIVRQYFIRVSPHH
jgi:D-glutamate cyclase